MNCKVHVRKVNCSKSVLTLIHNVYALDVLCIRRVYRSDNTSGEKIEAVDRVTWLQNYIVFKTRPLDEPRKRAFPKYRPRSRVGKRKLWYRGWYRANLHPRATLYRTQNYPHPDSESPRTIYRDLPWPFWRIDPRETRRRSKRAALFGLLKKEVPSAEKMETSKSTLFRRLSREKNK